MLKRVLCDFQLLVGGQNGLIGKVVLGDVKMVPGREPEYVLLVTASPLEVTWSMEDVKSSFTVAMEVRLGFRALLCCVCWIQTKKK